MDFKVIKVNMEIDFITKMRVLNLDFYIEFYKDCLCSKFIHPLNFMFFLILGPFHTNIFF